MGINQSGMIRMRVVENTTDSVSGTRYAISPSVPVEAQQYVTAAELATFISPATVRDGYLAARNQLARVNTFHRRQVRLVEQIQFHCNYLMLGAISSDALDGRPVEADCGRTI